MNNLPPTEFLLESEEANLHQEDVWSRRASYWICGFAVAMIVWQLLRALT